jgi:hypothetical protein
VREHVHRMLLSWSWAVTVKVKGVPAVAEAGALTMKCVAAATGDETERSVAALTHARANLARFRYGLIGTVSETSSSKRARDVQ